MMSQCSLMGIISRSSGSRNTSSLVRKASASVVSTTTGTRRYISSMHHRLQHHHCLQHHRQHQRQVLSSHIVRKLNFSTASSVQRADAQHFTMDSLPEWFTALRDDPANEKQFREMDFKFYSRDEMRYEGFDWERIAQVQRDEKIIDEEDIKNKDAQRRAMAKARGIDLPSKEEEEAEKKRKKMEKEEEEENEEEEDDDEGAFWHLSRLIPDADKVRLNGGRDKKYILVGAAFGFSDYRDTPAYFSSIRQSYLWLDPSSAQPKILVQLGACFPPLLWMPVKPQLDSLKRFFTEFATMESRSVTQNVQAFEDMLQAIQFKELSYAEEHTKSDLHTKILDYLNDVDPDTIPDDEHENTACFFMGNAPDLKILETNLMNNPFVFNTPILLGSSNKYMSSQPVQSSKFRTVFSRSVITIEVRNDLRVELGDGGMSDKDMVLPVFARINYPSNTRMSKPIPQRVNRIFMTDYPDDMPVDVIAALFGNAMRSYRSTYRDFEEILQSSGDIEAALIAHLAILRYPEFDKVFDRFYRHDDPIVRLACLKGASELGMKERVLEMKELETKDDISQMVDSILERWDARSERRQKVMTEYLKQQQEKAEKAADEEVERQDALYAQQRQQQPRHTTTKSSTAEGDQILPKID